MIIGVPREYDHILVIVLGVRFAILPGLLPSRPGPRSDIPRTGDNILAIVLGAC